MKKSSNSVISAASAYKGHLAIALLTLINFAPLASADPGNIDDSYDGIENRDFMDDFGKNDFDARDFGADDSGGYDVRRGGFGEINDVGVPMDDFGKDDFDARDFSADDSGGYDVRRGGFGEINDVGVPMDNFGKDDFDARNSSRDDFLDDDRFRKPLP